MPSFAVQLANLEQIGPVIEVKLAISSELNKVLSDRGENPQEPVEVTALVDTGATGTVIRKDIPEKLGIQPVGVAYISTPSDTNVPCSQYLVRVVFPNNVIANTIAIAADLEDQIIQCLIGRDVLAHSVMVYTGFTNTFTLSF